MALKAVNPMRILVSWLLFMFCNGATLTRRSGTAKPFAGGGRRRGASGRCPRSATFRSLHPSTATGFFDRPVDPRTLKRPERRAPAGLCSGGSDKLRPARCLMDKRHRGVLSKPGRLRPMFGLYGVIRSAVFGCEIKRARGRASSLSSRPLAVANPALLLQGGRRSIWLQFQYSFQLLFQLIFQLEWIQTFIALSQLPALFGTQDSRCAEPSIGGPG